MEWKAKQNPGRGSYSGDPDTRETWNVLDHLGYTSSRLATLSKTPRRERKVRRGGAERKRRRRTMTNPSSRGEGVIKVPRDKDSWGRRGLEVAGMSEVRALGWGQKNGIDGQAQNNR